MARGVYERPKGSGIWWILYYADGKRCREKVGRKSDAVKLYQLRKADALAGRKLPELRGSRVLTLSELIDDALEFVADHKDKRNYLSKGEIVRVALGSSPAADVTPQELERWLRAHCKTPATSNKRESLGRLRYLTRKEYDRLCKVTIDLLFYHLRLHYYFVIELKTGKFKPEWAGKLNFYLSAVDDLFRNEPGALTIGLLLCETHNSALAEYALRDIAKPVGGSTYRVTRELPAPVRDELPTVEDLQEVVAKLRSEMEQLRQERDE
jgi:hypothetical protein